MDTYSVAPPSDGYDYVNTDPSSPYYMWDYKLGSTAHGEVEHIYGDGRTDWVPESSANVSASSWTPPAGATPLTIETGSVPGAPIIHPPAAPSSPPAAPSGGGSSSGGSSSGGSSSGGSTTPPPQNNPEVAIQAIEDFQQHIENEISTEGATAGITPEYTFNTESLVASQINQLQDQIYSAYQSGSLNESQMQQMEASTVNLGMSGISQEVNLLEKQGGVTAQEQTAVQEQYQALSSNINTLTAKGAISQESQSDIENAMGNLDTKISSLQVSSGGSTTTPPTSPLGGGTPGQGPGQTSQDNNNGSNSSSSSGSTTTDNDPANPQLGNSGTLGSASTSTSTPAGGTYSVQPGDNMWAIAQANGISLGQLEAMNPQIRDPELIIPGQQINIPGGGTETPTSPSSNQDAGLGITISHNNPIMSPDGSSGGTNTNNANSTDSSTGSTEPTSAIGFPEKSTYPPVGTETAGAGASQIGTSAEGWVDGSGNGTPDIAKGVFDVDTHASTDPLKIDEKK
jgi:spore coat assembly protein SafA